MFALTRKSILRSFILRTRITTRLSVYRPLTSGEAATALRPFLFSVHPDLFGQHPRERAVNEQSLKALNEYVTSLQAGRPVKPANVSFYVRGGSDGKSDTDFREIQLSLVSHDLSIIIRDILNSCGLSLDFVNSLETDQSVESFPRPIRWHQSYYAFTGKQNPEEQLHKTPTVTLRTWLRKNEEDARSGQRQTQPIRDEIERVRTELKEKIGLTDLTWESSWGVRHFRGCLHSFQHLYNEREAWINDALKGRRLIFSHCTGYSLHGDVVLSSEDVPSDWLKLLKSLQAYDTVLERLPYMECQLSNLLSNIRLVRRRRKHVITATHYELMLNKLTNSLRRVQDDVVYRLFAEDLSHLELIVDSEEGPLTLSPEGQFLVPASLPADQVIDFICSNKAEAQHLLGASTVAAQLECGVVDRCMAQLELIALLKEDSVSSSQMIDCCERLIQSYFDIGLSLKDACLCISHYYTVMGDGQIHIPWDWQLESNPT